MPYVESPCQVTVPGVAEGVCGGDLPLRVAGRWGLRVPRVGGRFSDCGDVARVLVRFWRTDSCVGRKEEHLCDMPNLDWGTSGVDKTQHRQTLTGHSVGGIRRGELDLSLSTNTVHTSQAHFYLLTSPALTANIRGDFLGRNGGDCQPLYLSLSCDGATGSCGCLSSHGICAWRTF